MKERTLYLIMALALVLCLALPLARPVIAEEIGGGKYVVWNSADGHPEGVYLIGQTVHYFMSIINESSTESMNVTISDRIPLEPHTYEEIPGVTTTYWWNDVTHSWDLTEPDTNVIIAPSESWNAAFNHTIIEDDVRVHPIDGYNVTVNRMYANGMQGAEGVGFARAAQVRVIQPHIELVKTVDPEEAQAGQKVTYSFTIKNKCDWPLEDITLDDDELGDLTGELLSNLVLNATGEAGDSYSFDYEYEIQAGDLPLVNNATVEGTAEGFDSTIFPDAVVSDSDTAEVRLQPEPSIDVEKAVWDEIASTWENADTPPGPSLKSAQDPVVFKFTVKNDGEVALNSVNLTDTHMTSFYDNEACTGDPVSFPTTLAVDQTKVYYGKLAWAQGQHSNNATADGSPLVGDDVDDTDPAYYFGAGPSIDVEKAVWDEIASTWENADTPPGPSLKSTQDPVVFKFTVKNDGNVALNSVNLTDTHMTHFYDNEACDISASFPTTLAVDQTRVYYGKLAWAPGQHGNNATAEGSPLVGDDVDDTDPAYYFGSPPTPDIDIEKCTNGIDADDPPGPYITIGNTVTWKYVVKNIGGVNLTNVVVMDDKLGQIGSTISLLPVDGTVTLYESSTAAAGQYANNASVIGYYGTANVTDWDLSHYFGRNVTRAVGWETYPINKVRVLLPWIILLAAPIAGASLLVLRHRRA